MTRLSNRDRRRLEGVEDALRCWRPGAPPILEELASELCEVLNTEGIGAYSIRVEEDRLLPESFVQRGMKCETAAAKRRFADFLRRNGRRPGAYDAAHPEPKQRNQMMVFPPTLQWLDQLGAGERSWESMLGTELDLVAAHLRDNYEPWLRPIGADRRQMRAILCDGDSLLAYLAAFQSDPFTARQRVVFKRLLGPLRARLELEEQLRNTPLAAAALDAALEAIPGAAFVVTAGGAIVVMNAAGARSQRENPRLLAELLRDSARGARTVPAFRITPLAVPGLPTSYLAVEEPAGKLDPARLAAARARWGLTRRQTEVLGHVVRGRSNKAIAVELGIGQSTVELHVTKLFEKIEATSRSQLIAWFWMTT